ncbi:MAG TPA: DinB family protein [Bryobacteraceae bacterium]|nr:DinB family protein [Bryobacteraceae bacterium]
MTRYLLTAFLAACLFACVLQAQPPAASVSAETKQAFASIKGNLLKTADKVSEADYSFKPTPEIRSFGEMVAHVADSALMMCSRVKGEQRKGDAATKKSKADLTAALKASLDYCDSAYDSLTDANALEPIQAGRGMRTRVSALVSNTVHLNESYGYLAVYLRLKGITPPSSDR